MFVFTKENSIWASIQIWTFILFYFFYLLQCIIAFGKQQRVLQLLGYRNSVYSAVFPAYCCSTHAQTNKCSTECERQTTEKKHMNIRMDVTNDRRKKLHGGSRHSLAASPSLELGSASLQTLIVQQHVCFNYDWKNTIIILLSCVAFSYNKSLGLFASMLIS